MAAARRLLEREGSETAISLRAVGREAGVTAPAIYAHFADRESIIAVVIIDAFQEFRWAIDEELRRLPESVSPLSRLQFFCMGYVRYAHQHPAAYQILFTRHAPSAVPEVGSAAADAFSDLVDTLDACTPFDRRTEDTFADAVLLWAALHGLASLPPHHSRFPWPELSSLINVLVQAHAHVGPDDLAAAQERAGR